MSTCNFFELLHCKYTVFANTCVCNIDNLHTSESYDSFDELVMKAKINFFATVVGSHPNIVEFIGSVTDHPSCKYEVEKNCPSYRYPICLIHMYTTEFIVSVWFCDGCPLLVKLQYCLILFCICLLTYFS